MKNYEETIRILNAFYNECVNYWKNQNSKVPYHHALQDLMNLKNDPYSPDGDELDFIAKADMISELAERLPR